MILHPEAQEKAQREVDSVTFRNRLPDFSDRPSLPYIDAVLKEVLRWNPVAPLGETTEIFVIDIADIHHSRPTAYGLK